ncbi:MAG: hypothetical protein AABW56_02355 [Nanoarchaeota archaeon]|mgnify:CR=1 FL=1
MKRVLFVLIFIVLIQIATATNNLITPVDFSLENQVIYKLEDGDGISFYIKDKAYVMSIDQIGKSSARIKSFYYNKEGSRETFYVPLNGQFSYKLDFDKDDIYDIKVDLVRIESTKAVLFFEKIEEPKNKNQVTSEATSNNKIIDTKGVVIAFLIVIAGLISYFTFRKK